MCIFNGVRQISLRNILYHVETVRETRKEPATESEKMEDLFENIIVGDTERVNKIIQKEPQLVKVSSVISNRKMNV